MIDLIWEENVKNEILETFETFECQNYQTLQKRKQNRPKTINPPKKLLQLEKM